ncbi:hypothetical protein SCUP234_05941 [Seiridium cupressi]
MKASLAQAVRKFYPAATKPPYIDEGAFLEPPPDDWPDRRRGEKLTWLPVPTAKGQFSALWWHRALPQSEEEAYILDFDDEYDHDEDSRTVDIDSTPAPLSYIGQVEGYDDDNSGGPGTARLKEEVFGIYTRNGWADNSDRDRYKAGLHAFGKR